jgi:hypothetical protein
LKASENIFELIQVLSPEEKQIIGNSSNFHVKGGENKYAILFKLIEAQSEYNEDVLIEHFQLIKAPNKFAFLKNYTYNFILDALEEKSKFILKHLRSKITQAEIMISKKLYTIALMLLNDAEEEVAKRQLYEMWATIIKIKIEHSELFKLDKEELHTHYNRILSAKKSFYHYRKLFSLVRGRHHQSSFVKDIDNAKEFRDVHEEELLESDSNYNFHHKLYFFLSKGIVYFAKRDFEKAYIMVNELLKMWNKHPQMIAIRFGGYYNTLYNKALIEFQYKQYVKALDSSAELLDKLHQLKRENPYHYFTIYNLQASIYIGCGYFDKALKITDQYKIARDLLPATNRNPNSEQRYQFYMANIYFGVGDYKAANRHINEIINSSIEYNTDITCIAQLMSLVVHYEMGNSELLNYRIKSAYRFLSKKDCLQLTITHVLEFLKKAIKVNSQKPNKEMFTQLLHQIEHDIKMDPIQSAVLDYFNIIAWLQSKIQHKPFMVVLKEESNFALD